MAVAMWADLTPAQQASLVSAPHLDVATGCELLAFDLSVVSDITTDLGLAGSDIVWTGAATVHRDCQVTLARLLDWGNDLVRIYRTFTDKRTGLAARVNRGVFCLTAPDTALGTTPQRWKVAGQDRLYLLNRQPTVSYVVTAGTGVLDAISAVFTAAGLPGVLVDTTAAASTVPTDMAWPLVAAPDTSSTVAAATAPPEDSGLGSDTGSGATTWQRIVNDLCRLVNYRAVWCDDDGNYRVGPYAAPEDRAPTFTWDANDPKKSTVSVDRGESGNFYATDTPNHYTFVWANMPLDLSGNEQTPTEGNGVYTVAVTTGPTAPAARNGLVWGTQVSYTAASQADLVAQGNRRVAADLRRMRTLTASTPPYPAGHYDVFTVNDAALDDGTAKVEAQAWTEPLDGFRIEWVWQEVA